MPSSLSNLILALEYSGSNCIRADVFVKRGPEPLTHMDMVTRDHVRGIAAFWTGQCSFCVGSA